MGLAKKPRKISRGRFSRSQKKRKKRFMAKSTNKFAKKPMTMQTMYAKVGTCGVLRFGIRDLILYYYTELRAS